MTRIHSDLTEVTKAHTPFLILQVSVLRGAPETVRELLGMLGLQKYTLGLSLHGWDDLDLIFPPETEWKSRCEKIKHIWTKDFLIQEYFIALLSARFGKSEEIKSVT